MVIFLLNIILLALNTILSLVSRLIFTVTAYFLVLVIQGLKVPGEAVKCALEQFADVVRSFAEYLAELALEAMSNLISTLFDLLKEGVSGSASAAGSAIGGLAEQTRNSLDGLLKDLPEVLEGFSEMISNVVTDLWNNYNEAVGYVTKNA